MSHLGLPGLKTLVLNADMQPLSWGPLSVWSWQDALVAVLKDRVHQVCAYELVVRSASRSFQIPSVVALKDYHRRKSVSFTRYHVFLRDGFRCQYCGKVFDTRDLTFDHVIPRSKGGKTTWDNIVTCCAADNLRKGAKSLREAGMHLNRRPFTPTPYQMDVAAKHCAHVKDELHETWMDFLYWDAALEE
ncbi:HNH endonuclease family protein [Paramagnetospirillum magnetotacticum MS-1]|uniref:HNH endonuclease family protein n=1 Tax=Paramagnetospirillum magnetotacticum MS-1 TaxID=272627 RepID=A0A0C2UYW4_PARME|nr:HNH endonuclease [Paramagnetospirillum magnetotacticum]KIL98036.1 HNH endonuclease family protein [Paramagnetospirillum magnetotacticum MS-1]